MTYRELLEFTKKHPNPFWNKEQHNKEFEYRYKAWVAQQNQECDAKKDKTQRRTK